MRLHIKRSVVNETQKVAKHTVNQNNSKKTKTRKKSARTKDELYEESNSDLNLVDEFLMEIVKVISSLYYPE